MKKIKFEIETWMCDTCGYKQDFEGTECPNRRCSGALSRVTSAKDKAVATVADPTDLDNDEATETEATEVDGEVEHTERSLTADEKQARKAKIEAKLAELRSDSKYKEKKDK